MGVLDGTPHPKDTHLTQQAESYFKALSQWAVHAGTAVDVFAVGNLAVNAPMLSRLCDATGGALTLHKGTANSAFLCRQSEAHLSDPSRHSPACWDVQLCLLGLGMLLICQHP